MSCAFFKKAAATRLSPSKAILGIGDFLKWICAIKPPAFQAATATFAGSETKVDTGNTTRGPLLITGGGDDHIAPPILGQASLKKYNPSVVSEFKLFEGRGHSLIVDHGWKDVAEYSLAWLNKNGF